MRHLQGPAPRFADPDRRAKLEKAFPEIDKLFQDYAARAHVPGAAWGIIIDGELAHSGVTGYRDVPSKAPVTPDSVFRIASMTKSFTAIAILKLRDEGKLSLDDPAEKYVPEMKALVYPTSDSPKITDPAPAVARGRIPRGQPVGRPAARGHRRAVVGDDQGGIPFSNAPGIAYEYSNFGFAILGRIVANVVAAVARAGSRRTAAYTQYVTEHVLKPLGMTSTTLEPSRVPPDRLAHGYRWEDSAVEERAAAGERLVRLDGRHADDAVGSRPLRRRASSPPGRRATGRRRGPIKRSSLREMQQVCAPVAGGRVAKSGAAACS